MGNKRRLHYESTRPKPRENSIFVESECYPGSQNKLPEERMKKAGNRITYAHELPKITFDFQQYDQTYCTKDINRVTCKHCLERLKQKGIIK